MTRIKGGFASHRKHKKILKLAKGYRMSRRRLFRSAQQAVLHAGEYAFAGRKQKKRQFRSLWITRINAALQSYNIKYNLFIKKLSTKNIQLDRKILSKIAQEYPKIFKQITNSVMK